MIDLKVEEEQPEDELRIEFTEEQKQAFEEIMRKQRAVLSKTLPPEIVSADGDITKELHELNKTLREILREMRKRKV